MDITGLCVKVVFLLGCCRKLVSETLQNKEIKRIAQPELLLDVQGFLEEHLLIY